MKNYIEEQNENTKKYYNILSKEFPAFLNDYIYTLEMQKLDGINQIHKIKVTIEVDRVCGVV